MFEEDYQGEERIQNVNKYEDLLKKKEPIFFDVEEFEGIIDFYIENNQINSAYRATHIASRLYPSSVEILLKKSQLLIDKDKPEEALKTLNNLRFIDPGNADIFLAIGISLIKMERVTEACRNIDKSFDLSNKEDALDILMAAADQLHVSGYQEEAAKYWQRALEFSPENINVLFDYAVFCTETKANEKAIELLNTAIEIDPFFEISWYNLAFAYSNNSDFIHAIEALDYAIAIEPDYPEALYMKGLCHFYLSDNKEAISALVECISLDSLNVDALKLLSASYSAERDYENAKYFLSQYLKLLPDQHDSLFDYGLLWFESGNSVKALKFIKKAIQLSPQSYLYYLNYGMVCLESDMLTEGYSFVKKAMKMNPDDYRSWLLMAGYKEQMESTLEALKTTIAAIRHFKDENYYLFYFYLSFYNFKMGRQRSGLRYFDKANALNEINFADFEVLQDNKNMVKFQKFLIKAKRLKK
ncbi:MAG: hypothetical protein CVU05_14470 [Bacteroidetes bacterium HGW-Bacteroidetes-21]|jgi:tetratricopeptide (TPR) repeat protein|nr:MAG: hypothetical protein CVU05_14470 [Bacteroidetes bacterium HGW-Bacteroidetes-21]